MSWTYSTLTQAIQDYIVSTETTLVNNLPVIVQQAEDRILARVQLPVFRKNVTGSVTQGDPYLGLPADFLAPYSLALDNSGFEYLLFKDVNYIREAYPITSDTGTPKTYSLYDDDFFIVGPTPDTTYAVELHYFYRPESIVTAGTSWLGTNAPSCLFYGCLVEAYTFQKGEADMLALCNEKYKEALQELMILAEARNKTDTYRSG